MTRNQECGDKVLSDATAQEIDGGAGRAVVIDEVAPVASMAIETRACVIEDYAGGGIALGSKPTTNIASALGSAEMGSHNADSSSAGVAGELVPECEGPPVDADYFARLIPVSNDSEGDCVLKHKLRQETQYTADVDSQGRLLSDAREYHMAKSVGIQILLRVRNFDSESEAKEFVYQCHDGGRSYKPADLKRMRYERVRNLLSIPKMTYAAIAHRTGMEESTIRKIHKRKFPDVTREDGRHISAAQEARIRQLAEAGDPITAIATMTGVSTATIRRKLKPAPTKIPSKAKRESVGVTAEDGKTGKASTDSAARPAQVTVDIAANDGVPEFHQRVLEYLGRDAQAYAGWFKAAANHARQDSEAAANNAEKLLRSVLYCNQRAEADKFWLRKILANSGEGCAEEATPDDPCLDTDTYKIGDVHHASVLSVEPDGVYVALPGGVCGMIRNGDTNFAIYAPLEGGTVVRVRIKGADPKRCLLDLQLLGRQTSYPATDTITARSERDERWSPHTVLAGLKAGPEETEVPK